MLGLVSGGNYTNIVHDTDYMVKEFAEKIINKMKDNNVLCETEGMKKLPLNNNKYCGVPPR